MNNSWKLKGTEFWPNGNKHLERFEKNKKIIEKWYSKNGKLGSIDCYRRRGNLAYVKHFLNNGEIWLEVYDMHNSRINDILIGTVKSNEKHELKANE